MDPTASSEALSSQPVELGDIQETLLIPLYGRAVEARKKRPLLRDEKAVRMVNAIDYEFSKFDGMRSLFGSVLRTAIYDEWVKEFIARHPAGTIIEIGAGLNTRFERLDNGQLRWFDLDLPDTIALRRRFFADGPRRSMVEASITDPAWVAAVKQSPGPYFFVAEAVLIYIESAGVRAALATIAREFPGACLALDTMNRWAIENQHEHEVLKKMAARMKWACDDARELESWGLTLRLVESRTLAQAQSCLQPRIPWFLRTLGPVLFRKQVNAYRLHLFDVAGVPVS